MSDFYTLTAQEAVTQPALWRKVRLGEVVVRSPGGQRLVGFQKARKLDLMFMAHPAESVILGAYAELTVTPAGPVERLRLWLFDPEACPLEFSELREAVRGLFAHTEAQQEALNDYHLFAAYLRILLKKRPPDVICWDAVILHLNEMENPLWRERDVK